MARDKSTTTALAVADLKLPALPAPGSEISAQQAIDIAKNIAGAALKAARAERAQKLAALGRELGGQISRLDDDVVEQGRKWAARIAAIAAKKKSGRNGGMYGYSPPPSSDPLDKIVAKIAAILGELEGLRLVDRALGLFEQIDESQFNGRGQSYAKTWQEAVGEKAEAAATEVLSQYKIVTPEPVRGGKGSRGGKLPKHGRVKAKDIAADAAEGVADAMPDEDAEEGQPF